MPPHGVRAADAELRRGVEGVAYDVHGAVVRGKCVHHVFANGTIAEFDGDVTDRKWE